MLWFYCSGTNDDISFWGPNWYHPIYKLDINHQLLLGSWTRSYPNWWGRKYQPGLHSFPVDCNKIDRRLCRATFFYLGPFICAALYPLLSTSLAIMSKLWATDFSIKRLIQRSWSPRSTKSVAQKICVAHWKYINAPKADLLFNASQRFKEKTDRATVFFTVKRTLGFVFCSMVSDTATFTFRVQRIYFSNVPHKSVAKVQSFCEKLFGKLFVDLAIRQRLPNIQHSYNPWLCNYAG